MSRWARSGDRYGPPSFTSQALPPPKPTGPVIESIVASALLVENDAPHITNVQYVASYNWLNDPKPIILVPGSPRAWTPPVRDEKVKGDSGEVFRDMNSGRYPRFPMEPALRSIKVLHPKFDMEKVDIIGCGSTLGSLLRFAASTASKPFRIDVDVVGRAIVLVRKGNSPDEKIKDLRGYGHTFPEAYTTWGEDVGNSCSHQRIIKYDFGGLNLLVRYEVDGYVKEATEGAVDSHMPWNNSSVKDVTTSMTVDEPAVQLPDDLEVRARGQKVPQANIFDIKTRRENKKYDMEDILSKLWLSQIPKFLIAYHRFGLFESPKVVDVRNEVSEWQNRNINHLARFHAVLKRIVNAVLESKDKQLAIYWDGEGPLEITKQVEETKRVLPDDFLAIWDA